MKKDFLQILVWTILWAAEIRRGFSPLWKRELQLHLLCEEHKNARQKFDRPFCVRS